jgi:hypothetical protein
VFKISTDGSNFSSLKAIPGSDAPGRAAGLICCGDQSFGTTTGDLSLTSHGTVVMMKKDGSGFTVLKRFTGMDGDGHTAGF